jgi:hypothetical protein
MATNPSYKLLDSFRSLFENTEYRHRDSTRGDFVASFLVEDLLALERSAKLKSNIDNGHSVANSTNKTTGKPHRRGDGFFGAAVPGIDAEARQGYAVRFGKIAAAEIGTETKILAKAMIKQLDRVGSDMINQAAEFRGGGNNPICVGVIGVNYAPIYRSLEGDREFATTGSGGYKHPAQEAQAAEQRLVARVSSSFDELIVLRFIATNIAPFEFRWVDPVATAHEYGATLVRISRYYEQRF